MRKLNKKQKTIIEKIYRIKPIYSYTQMDRTDFIDLEKINDFETLPQDVDRYLQDLKCIEIKKRLSN